jgi:hypothetical protein
MARPLPTAPRYGWSDSGNQRHWLHQDLCAGNSSCVGTKFLRVGMECRSAAAFPVKPFQYRIAISSSQKKSLSPTGRGKVYSNGSRKNF